MDDLRRHIIPRGYGTNATYVYEFSRGLGGVNVPRDVIITRIIYVSVLALAFIVFCGRIAQISHAYLRHITSLNSSKRQQTYWSVEESDTWTNIKKHLLYSPLGRKRHNREIQLSSAINVGTLPSRFQTILILLYLASQVAYCTILDYRVNEKKALVAELRGRSGTLAVLNMVPLFLLAGRNNPLIAILHISFDTYNCLHRWLGRIVVIESVVHTVAWAVNAVDEVSVSDMLKRLCDTPFFTWGLVGTVAMVFLSLHSPSPVRHAFYETFLHLHQLAALLAYVGVWFHLDLDGLPQKPWAIAIAAIWIFDRAARFSRLLYLNISPRKGATKLVVQALPGEACKVTFHLPKHVHINPGSHVYTYIPSVSLWMSHPFSVAWVDPCSSVTNAAEPEKFAKSPTSTGSMSPSLLEKQPVVDLNDYMRESQEPTSVSLIVSARQGMTRKLYNKALIAPNQKQARLTDPIYRREKKRQSSRTPPKLGILDAPDVASRPRNEQPQFLRVAARKARSRQDRGRRSPSNKVIKMSSALDTEDANTSLREWRAGRIRQSKLPRPHAKPPRRPPLADLSSNMKIGAGNHVPGEINKDHPIIAGPATQQDDTNVVQSQMPAPEAPPPTTAPPISEKPMQRIQYGNNWFVRRNVVVSSLKRNDPRPVGLEMASLNVSRAPSFQRSLSLLNQNTWQKRLPDTVDRNIILNRFLVDSGQASVHAKARGSTFTRESNDASVSLPKRPVQIKRKLKKRIPMRLDVSTTEGTNQLILSTDLDPPRAQGKDAHPSKGVSDGLSGFQRSYSTDFSITPLCLGTFFHESSFIGSGEFNRSLEIGKRDLDQNAGIFTANVRGRTFRWGPWNDAVSSELGIAFDDMLEEMEKSDTMSTEAATDNAPNLTYTIYRTLVKYITEALTFIDPIDRTGFITRAHALISKVNDNLTSMVSPTGRGTEYRTRIASYNVVFANLTYQVACHTLVNDSVTEEVLELMRSASRQAFAVISSEVGKINIRKFLENNKVCEQRDKGVRDEYPAVEAYIIVRQVLYSTETLKGFFEELIADSLLAISDQSNTKNIDRLESGWHWLFTTLPLGEIDALGIARIGSRFSETCNNWKIVKQLLCPVLESYEPNTSASISYNTYCRALFHRCFHLINGWGWRDCKLILDTLYDFFARNTLYNLKQEENYTSPSFLDELDHNPSLDVTPSDPCFHIFLKIIASGLRSLSKRYDKKKVRNFAWRLLPNHGRVYPKEQPIHQADLDALRNHHDLLCTLYFAVPDGCRPRLEAIKNLVHPANSHRETCNISIRSWARLVRFKLSTDEDVSGLEAFADWHSYFVSEFIKQHMLARREIEAQNTKDNQFSHQLIERTISQNQRQIESLLKTALNSLQNAIQSAPTLEHAHRLISKSPISVVLGLFDPRLARVNTTVSEALQMLKAYVQKCSSASATGSANPPAPVDEDSQEYGDWADIEAMYGDEFSLATHPQGIEYMEKVLHPAVSQLVSNSFGEDHCPEDAILLNVVDCWTSIAQVLVKNGFRHWDNYLSLYDGDSWAVLRKTAQTRKFTPKFLASCIEKDARFMCECKMQVLGMWMSSLVERVSMLKFQHSLTEALLNCDSNNTLLQNLPFSADRKDGRYSITLEQLSQRRLSLISSLLSNMRAHVQDLEITASRALSTEKQEYRELIQTMMSSMKANYQELGSSAASAQGAYVDFVHRVVGFLQQHTRDICPVDPFFTDPTSFPLPSTDPTYIVARLKGYEPKLSSEKVAKTLIMFVQGISERAAIDGQQVYLVDQLQTSIAHTYEAGDPVKPTLRATLLQSVFPAYLQTAFSNPGAWLLSQPIIQTISHTFKELLFHIDATDTDCVASVVGIFGSVFQSSYHALHSIVDNANMLKEPPVVITVASFIEMITSSLRVVDYIDRSTDVGDNIISQIHAFRQFILFSTSFLHDQLLIIDPENIPHPSNIFTTENTPTNAPKFFQEIRISATRELRTYINESWSRHQGKYYFTRRGGHHPQEVNLEPSMAANLENFPLAILDDAARNFLDTLRALDSFDTFH